MRYALSIAVALAAFATPAHAQELSGFRIEARGGWEQLGGTASIPNPDYDEDDEESGPEFLKASDNDGSIGYGVELGYDVQMDGGFVIGGYAGADLSDSRMCVELIEDDLGCTKLKRSFTIGARAGLPLGETSLIYVKGGYSYGKLSTVYDPDLTDNDDEEPGDIFEFSKNRSGFHAGGGVQLGLTETVYAKLEYVYTKYGSGSYRIGDDEEDPVLKTRSDRHQLSAGIGLRF